MRKVMKNLNLEKSIFNFDSDLYADAYNKKGYVQ